MQHLSIALRLLSLSCLLVLDGCSDDSTGSNDDAGTNHNTNAICGDGQRAGAEQCDGADLASETCQSLGHPGGTLGCDADCTFDRTGCDPLATCGDGDVDPGEDCDGADLGGESCATQSAHSDGELQCTAACLIDVSRCHTCGNGAREGPEVCDGSELAGETCQSQTGLADGDLGCGGSCLVFNVADCHACGNGTAEGPEPCDGPDLKGETCSGLGFSGGGSLACAPDCTFDTSPCCGDGSIGGSETCDDGNAAQYDGCHQCGIDDIDASGVVPHNAGRPRVCTAPGGELVVAWYSSDPSSQGPVYRRFASTGSPLGSVQVVDLDPSGAASQTDVSADATGGVVVVWDETHWGNHIHARLFDANDIPLGPSFEVNILSTGEEWWPRVDRAPAGWFVVTWRTLDGSGEGVYARVYSANGTAVTPPFRVNETTSDDQQWPDVAIGSNGDFVIVWTHRFTGGQRVYARAYDSAGNPLTGEFDVSPTTTPSVYHMAPSITPMPAGGYMVVWTRQTNSNDGIEMRRLNSAAVPTGNTVTIDPTISEVQLHASGGVDSAGNYVVTWCRACGGSMGDGDADDSGIMMRRFDALDNLIGTTEIVNHYTLRDQYYPCVAMNADGRFAVAWQSLHLVTSSAAMFQRFTAAGQPLGSLPW